MNIFSGDALTVLRTMPEASVNCCVTSPPYWGLRDYGTGKWIDGHPDMPNCKHESTRGVQGATGERATRRHTQKLIFTARCQICGAIRVDQQIGLEQTMAEYIGKLADVFRGVRRVLRPDGVLWLNLGDSYSAHPGQRKVTDKAGSKQVSNGGSTAAPSRHDVTLKPKDLCGIPWRVALALQDDGWWLRSDVIWCSGCLIIDFPGIAEE